MKSWWTVALGIVLGLLSTGVILLASQPPRGNSITLLPPPTPIPIQVYISREVQNPGVYSLSRDSRVQNAVLAAGGFTNDFVNTSLILSAHLEEGIRVHIPGQIQAEITAPTAASTSKDQDTPSRSTSLPTEFPSKRININTADQTTLETLSGIGPVTALKVTTFREENDPFMSIDEIQKVSGIDPAIFEDIKDFFTVDDQP